MSNRYTSAVRYASRQTGFNFEKWLVWGALGAGAYLLYKVWSGVSAVGTALTSTGAAIGSGLYDYLNADEIRRLTFEAHHIVRFPDGKLHAVSSNVVNNAGIFKNLNLAPNYPGDGKTYRLMTEKSSRSNWFAVPM